MAFCIPQPSSGGWDRQPDAMLLRWSLADPVASVAINRPLQKELLPRAHRPPAPRLPPPVLRPPMPVRFKMSQKRMNMSREGIDAFCDFCKMGTVITQVTYAKTDLSARNAGLWLRR